MGFHTTAPCLLHTGAPAAREAEATPHMRQPQWHTRLLESLLEGLGRCPVEVAAAVVALARDWSRGKGQLLSLLPLHLRVSR